MALSRREDVYPRRFEVARLGSQAMRLRARMSGFGGFARSRESSAPNVRIVASYRNGRRHSLAPVGQDATGADFVMGVYTIQLPASAVPGCRRMSASCRSAVEE